MGLQNADGNFVVNNLDPIAEEMLRNLGENIYEVTQNGRILENRDNPTDQYNENSQVPVDELQLFAHELLGQRKSKGDHSEVNANMFRLTISDDNANRAKEKKVAFDSIDVNINDNKLQELMNDLTLKDEEDSNFRDELLDMIGNNDIRN